MACNMYKNLNSFTIYSESVTSVWYKETTILCETIF